MVIRFRDYACIMPIFRAPPSGHVKIKYNEESKRPRPSATFKKISTVIKCKEISWLLWSKKHCLSAE